MAQLPWDDENVKANLEVLARLKPGNTLSVLKKGASPSESMFANLGKGGRGLRAVFDIQKGGFFLKRHQKSEREKKGEDILNDSQYLVPNERNCMVLKSGTQTVDLFKCPAVFGDMNQTVCEMLV